LPTNFVGVVVFRGMGWDDQPIPNTKHVIRGQFGTGTDVPRKIKSPMLYQLSYGPPRPKSYLFYPSRHNLSSPVIARCRQIADRPINPDCLTGRPLAPDSAPQETCWYEDGWKEMSGSGLGVRALSSRIIPAGARQGGHVLETRINRHIASRQVLPDATLCVGNLSMASSDRSFA